MEQGNQCGNDDTNNAAEYQRKGSDHRSSLTFLCTQALGNQDMLIGHYYATSGESNFAERYSGASVSVTRIGGAGGGNLEISCDITYGGTRTLGTITNTTGTVTFKADGAA